MSVTTPPTFEGIINSDWEYDVELRSFERFYESSPDLRDYFSFILLEPILTCSVGMLDKDSIDGVRVWGSGW